MAFFREGTGGKSVGVAFEIGPNGTVETDVGTCCHCNGPFLIRRGSGTRRGFCRNCMDITCGSEVCMPCVPFEKKMEAMER